MILYQGCKGEISPFGVEDYDFRKGFVIEEKYDGIWVAVVKEKGKVTLYSRTGKSKTNAQLQSLIKYAESVMPDDSILAGEMMFGSQKGTEEARLLGHHKVYVFDVLKWKGSDYIGKAALTFFERKKALKALMDELLLVHPDCGEWLDLAPFTVEFCGRKVAKKLKAVLDAGGEGLIAKEIEDQSPYIPGGKTKAWYKIKKAVTMDYVIMGYLKTESSDYASRGWIGSIVCGLYEDGVLTKKVDVGSMSFNVRDRISRNQDYFIGSVIEVGGNEVFKHGSMRHPYFIRFRDDKDAKDCEWKRGE